MDTHKCLRKLIAQKAATRRRDDCVYIGSLAVPENVIQQLQRMELVAEAGEGALVATDMGRAYMRRLDARQTAAGPGGGVIVNPFAEQHRRVVTTEIKEGRSWQKVRKNVAETPLGWLLKRKGRDGEPLISQDYYDAGERLRTDFELAQLAPSVTRNYTALPSLAGKKGQFVKADPTETQISAKCRFDKAVQTVGSDLSDILIRVCCHLEGLEEAERTLGWPSRFGENCVENRTAEVAGAL